LRILVATAGQQFFFAQRPGICARIKVATWRGRIARAAPYAVPQ
jgi:hypothetical protein